MLDTLRVPLFVGAIVILTIIVGIDIGSSLILQPSVQDATEHLHRPGLAISAMALVDGMLLYSVGLMGTALIIPERIQGRLQGLLTLILSLVALIVSVILIIGWVMFLMMIVALFLAVPFGTAIYFAALGTFPRSEAAVTLGILLSLKTAFFIVLILAQQRFLQNKGLMLLIATSFFSSILIAVLHSMPPRFLVTITDCIAAIIIGVMAALWCIFFLIGSIPSIIKVLRVDRSF